MLESLTDRDRFTWWFPLWAAGCAVITFFPLTISSSDDAVMLYVFVTVPVVSFVLLRIAFRRKGGQRLAAVSMFIVFVVFTAILFTRFTDIRNASRWLTYARVYKAEVLSGSEPGGGQLRHAELEGWGFPGAGDTVVYVVFDGVPCSTLEDAREWQIHRLALRHFSYPATGEQLVRRTVLHRD